LADRLTRTISSAAALAAVPLATLLVAASFLRRSSSTELSVADGPSACNSAFSPFSIACQSACSCGVLSISTLLS